MTIALMMMIAISMTVTTTATTTATKKKNSSSSSLNYAYSINDDDDMWSESNRIELKNVPGERNAPVALYFVCLLDLIVFNCGVNDVV